MAYPVYLSSPLVYACFVSMSSLMDSWCDKFPQACFLLQQTCHMTYHVWPFCFSTGLTMSRIPAGLLSFAMDSPYDVSQLASCFSTGFMMSRIPTGLCIYCTILWPVVFRNGLAIWRITAGLLFFHWPYHEPCPSTPVVYRTILWPVVFRNGLAIWRVTAGVLFFHWPYHEPYPGRPVVFCNGLAIWRITAGLLFFHWPYHEPYPRRPNSMILWPVVLRNGLAIWRITAGLLFFHWPYHKPYPSRPVVLRNGLAIWCITAGLLFFHWLYHEPYPSRPAVHYMILYASCAASSAMMLNSGEANIFMLAGQAPFQGSNPSLICRSYQSSDQVASAPGLIYITLYILHLHLICSRDISSRLYFIKDIRLSLG